MFRAFENVIDNAMQGLDEMFADPNPRNSTQSRTSHRTTRTARNNGPFRTTHSSTNQRSGQDRHGFEARLESYIDTSIEAAMAPMEEAFERLFDENPNSQSRSRNSNRRNHSSRTHQGHANAHFRAHHAAHAHAENQHQNQQPDRPRGLTESQMKKLRRHQWTKQDDQCTICMEDYVLSFIVRTLPCKHYFHVECIDPWLKRNASCPTCRAVINV